MISKKELAQLSEQIGAIKSLTRVFEQAAARRIKINQVEIEKINSYLSAARQTYTAGKKAVVWGLKPEVGEVVLRSSLRNIQGKRALILITSQNNYYGSLISNMVDLFASEYKKAGGAVIVLGKIGMELLRKHNIDNQNITYYDFDDNNFDTSIISKVSGQVAGYGQIIVFFGQYQGILRQAPASVDLGQSVTIEKVPEINRYLFRPEPKKSLVFLETQIIAGSILEKILQTGVAKYAVRVKILEIGQVAQRISEALDQIGKNRLRVRKHINNKKQLQLLTGAALWKQEGIVTQIFR